ncbi:MAG: Omp28-related outer membrane protein [Muribaculaceae bacterium]|nr:Omp28-related outer membrane protein [Muribaculaceae bacterium]
MTKHLLLFSLLFSGATVVDGAVTLPPYSYQEDFRTPLSDGEVLPDGWKSYGIGEVVESAFQDYFGTEGGGAAYRVFSLGGMKAAWSCSTFKYAATADEWLVTPPIHISSDAEVLQLKAVSAGAFATNRYRVLISEDGQDRDSFRPTPLLNTTLTGYGSEVRSKDSYIALNGYAGKEVCFAFINRGEDAGLLGFTDIAIAPYIAEVTDLTPSVLPAGSTTDIVLNVNLRTPADVPGLKAELEYNGQTVTQQYDQPITISGSRIAVTFEDITVPEGGLAYSVTLTPMSEGAEPTVVTGEIGTPTTSYPAVAVIEEFTGTWCTYCPRGAAFMNYYTDHYDGLDGRIKAVGIALHTTNDPMLMDDDAYLVDAYNISGSSGYPSAFFNRMQLGDPSDEYIVSNIAATRSNSKITIASVDYTQNGELSVNYQIENSYSKSDINQRVAIVMIENDVRGDNPAYNQTNGLSGVSQVSVENTYGADLWPYFRFYSEHKSIIPYTEMVYNHVARGIWPDYYGELLNDPCEAEIAIHKTMPISMPSQVMNPDNTAVIVLLLDGNTGYVLGADEMEAAHYNTSGINIVSRTDDVMSVTEGVLNIDLACEGRLEIFSADGTVLLSRNLAAGHNSIDLSSLRGFVILRVVGSDGQVSVKRHIF